MTGFLGRQLGNYRLTRLLGQGGFAEVYQGQHTHLDTWAAIKVLRAELYTEKDINLFRTEARTIANLQHPNIVRVLDFGVENGIPFLVMEYAPNGTMLNRHARGSKVPFQYVISYAKQVASALQYAHDRKVVHRDVKPANILLGPGGEILLSDFGLALIAESMTAGWGSNNSTKDAAGTVAYMAPEQLRGKPSAKSDQYSLAIMVYEWLTGELPFRGAYLEIATMHAQMPPPPPREKEPSIPADVEYVVLKALSKDPQERFNSVQAFATALEQAFSGPVSAVTIEPSKKQEGLTFEKTQQWQPSVQAYLYGPSGRMELTGEFSIGRRPDNNLVITDPLASGYHAKILPLEAGYGIKDMGSANKTIINERDWLESGGSQALKPGDVIRLGSTKFIYEEAGANGAVIDSQGQTVRDPQINVGNFTPPPPPSQAQASFYSVGTPPPAQNSWYGNSAPPPYQPNPSMPPPSQPNRPPHAGSIIGQSRTAKLLIGLIVALVIISSVAFFALRKGPGPSTGGPGVGTSTTAPTQATTPTRPTPTPTSAPSPVWNVILNSATSSLAYNNFTVNDTVGHHFLVVSMSFANNTTQTQRMDGSLLDLQDSTGQHYPEDQASSPQHSLYVNAGQSIQTDTSYVVPDSQCNYTLVFTDPTGTPSPWTITVTGSYCTG